MAMTAGLSLNGTAPVNTYGGAKRQLAKVLVVHSSSPATYLDHDHREGKNVRFLTMYPLVQDLRCSPPCGVTMLTRGTPRGIRVFNDSSKAEICEARMTGIVHKDVWLGVYQCGGETRLRVTTYSLEVPMNDIAGVEVTEALSDVG